MKVRCVNGEKCIMYLCKHKWEHKLVKYKFEQRTCMGLHRNCGADVHANNLDGQCVEVVSHPIREKLKERLIDEMAEKTLVYGMKFMGLYARLSLEFARNFDNFTATYQFIKYPESVGKTITVVVKFQGRHVKVSKKRIPLDQATITVFFRDGSVIIDYLRGKDIFRKVICGDVVVWGSVNYITKLGYLVNHLRGKCGLPR